VKLIGRIYKCQLVQPKFEVPFYHRVALGLESNTTVFLTPVPRSADSDAAFSELLITTVEPKLWSRLWRLSLTLKEGPGRVSEVLESLKNYNVNISTLETLTTERDEVHALLAIVDMGTVHGAESENAPHSVDLMQDSDDPIATSFREIAGDWLKKDILKAPSSFTRLARLFEAGKKRQAMGWSAAVEARTIEGSIVPVFADEFRRYFQSYVLRATATPWPTRYLLFSDTEEKHLTVHFVEESEVLLRASITHGDRPGAILDFARAFVGANILNSYSRLRKSGHSAQWKVTLDVTKVNSCASILIDATSKSASGENAFFEYDQIDVSLGGAAASRSRDQEVRAGYGLHYESTTHFLGRDKVLSVLAGRCRDVRPVVCLISAYSGSGKSLLLERLRGALKQEKDVLPVLIRRSDIGRGRSINSHEYPRDYLWWMLIAKIHEELYEATHGGSANDDFMRCFVSKDMTGAAVQDLRADEAYTSSFLNALRQTVEAVRAKLKRGVVILFDNAEVLLDPKPGAADTHDLVDRVAFAAQWKAVLEDVPGIAWILASATHCLRTSVTPGGAIAFDPISLYPIDGEAARQLVVEPFKACGVYMPDISVAEILALTGMQPLFIQAVCFALQDELNSCPSCVDIVTPAMVRRAKKSASRFLAQHFQQLRLDLLEVAGLDMLTAMSRPGAEGMFVSTEEFVRPEIASTLECHLRAIPGLDVRVSDADGRNVEEVRLTPLFRSWLEKGVE
jgi:hypothetical protein